ncbi:MAG: VCBS repeat-containing protein [Chloroflexi bacterium]|nr:VCBS repeat-containing protein [Chloroflexota bacterium]
MPRISAAVQPGQKNSLWRLPAALLAALLLVGLLLTGLAAAQEQTRLPSAMGFSEPALLPRQAITPTNTILPEIPQSSGLPGPGRALATAEIPAWVADLLVQGGPEGVTNGQVIVWKDVESGLAADGQAVNGGLITYAISVTNNTTTTIRNISLLDVLPRGALQEPIECIPNIACQKIVEAQEIPEPLGGTILVTETRQISWTIASVAPGTSAVRRFRGRLVGQTDGSVLKNQAFATYEANGAPQAVSSNETQTIVKVDALLGAGATMARAATWFSSDRGGTLSLDWGDFDRDGDLDLALGSSLGTTIYRNEGGRLRLFWANSRPTYGVRWGDFNGNGTLELVAVGDGGTEGLNYVYTIAGTSVQESARFTSTHPFVRVVAGDFDRDGDLDLILSTNAINAACPVQMYKNSGGVFTRPTDANGGCVSTRATAALAAGDWDNDGDLDLALGLFPNSVQLFVNDGTGLFPVAQHRIIDTSATFLPYDFAWGDFDGDGYLDLAAAYPLLRQARIYRNLSGNGFATFATLRTDRFLIPFSLDWGDFTGDGLLDLAVANLSPLIYEQTPAGFVRRPQLTVDNVRGQIWSLRGVDLDGDGDLDLAVTNRDGPSLMFTNFAPLLKTTLTPVPATTIITDSRATAPASSVAWGDLNGDGLADLVLGAGPSSAGPNALSSKLYYNTRGVFNRNDEIAIGGFGPHALALADVDNDNAIDLAVGTAQGTSVYLAGAFGSAAWSSNPPHVATTALAWGDYDDDQDLDLLVASSDGPLRLYGNLQSVGGADLLTTDPVWTSNEIANSQAIAWADLNGDNYLDFVVGNSGQPNRIYINQRTVDANLTSFVPLNWNVPAFDTRAVAWGDYDGDGDLDLAVGNYGESNLIYENRGVVGGLPIFSSTPIWVSSETSRTTSLAWGDWDNDGDLDLAVGNDGEADQVYVNRRDPLVPTSSAQLAWLWSSATAQRTSGVAWGDVDNDGDLDLAVSQLGDSSNGYNGYYENTTIVAAHLQDEYRSAIPLVINPAYLAVGRPGGSGPAALYAAPAILSGPKQPTVTVPFRIYDPDGIRNVPGSNGIGASIPITRLIYEYSLDGGGRWQRATGVLSNTSSAGSATSQEFTGVGSQTTALFGLAAGTAKFELKYDGTTLFTVWLLDAQGNLLGLLAEKVGAFDGTAELSIPADGSYRLRVVGNGQWSVKIQTSVAASLGFVTPTRLGQSYAFIWNAQADAAISENARFRIGLVQGDSVGPVKQASTAAVSPPFRVRGTTCVWPRGLSFRLSKENPNPQESVAFTGLLVEGTGVMTFTWDFGDGSTPLHGQRINHAYYYGGEYTVRVTATGAACPRGRPTAITGKVKIGGAAPIFLPFVSAQTGSRSGPAARVVALPGLVETVTGQLDGDSLQLRWSAPAVGGPIHSYRVYASFEGGAFEPIGVTADNRTQYTVRGQFCGAAYLVAPVGPAGEGPGSAQSYLAPACESEGGSQ